MKVFKKLTAISTVILLGLGVLLLQAPKANAFVAGRIIDDSKFTANYTMSAGDVQNFLNGKNSACLMNYQTPSIQGNNNYGGNVSAATAIKQAADIWGIAPQVLLVTLQKEQGLVTRGDCPDWRYQTAMGFGCPDGAPCDAQWYGLSRQLYQGARHLRGFFDQNSGWYIPFTPGVRYIPYHPNGGCGGSNVNIENRATASLYSYTPYQPNAAAQATKYGSGDGCSSYGNRNFASYYEDWFGSPFGEPNETNTNWLFESLDGSSNSVSSSDGAFGQNPKAISFNSSIQVFYYDVTNGNLKRASESGSGWNFETLDGAGGANGRIDANVGKTPTAVVYNNVIHVFYYDTTNGNLRHATSDASGGNWTFETLDGSGGADARENSNLGINPTVTVLGSGLQLYYYSITHGNLRHAWYDTTWHFENLDGDEGAVGHSSADLGDDPEVKVFNNNLQLMYYDVSNGNLRHAWTDSNGWHFENLDGDPGSVGRGNSNLGRQPALQVLNNNLQLFYYDVSNGNLRHAWTNSTGWHFENLDGDPGSVFRHNSNLGMTPAVTVQNNVLYLLYYDQQNGVLRHGYSDSTGWHKANLDGNYESVSQRLGNSGIDPTIIPYGGNVQAFYYDFSFNDLRHAWGPTP